MYLKKTNMYFLVNRTLYAYKHYIPTLLKENKGILAYLHILSQIICTLSL